MTRLLVGAVLRWRRCVHHLSVLCMGMRRAMLMLSTAALLTGCEWGSSAPPTDPGPDPNAPAFSVLPSATAISAPRGWNAIVNFSVARRADYMQAVTLAPEGLPPGVTASFTTPTLPATSSATRLDLEVDSLAAPGTFAFAVRVTGANATPSVTNLSITVPRPSFSIIAPASVSAPASSGFGSSVNFWLYRENSFRGAVTFTVTGAPAGVTIGSTFTIRSDRDIGGFVVSPGLTAVPGVYPLTLRVSGPEAEDRTASVTLTILPPV